MEVWVCGCVEVWVCGGVGVWRCRCVEVQVCGGVGVRCGCEEFVEGGMCACGCVEFVEGPAGVWSMQVCAWVIEVCV